ncbi:baeRF2 domain-containing protein [Mycobacterium montefiorense]|uniref:Uncharacterized protein n=1 Tax=Mycobacterium montefiorense TaxID=154654 RepID=A0AA37PM75_9MYCO|nr:hypothetical protein [Mycobacterium montefiorense]GBG40847.1 hypothetical protein MmonteBS_52190 [Mycobacterium montefiorense]GKU33461.1 hypothetical protein NJB14191_08080 [Mycobacterium montefiorense]GKU39957.1 hypothetical protein NJB14192_19460 [Mycobacterium montefiorense]GKU45293.1 hypothetical protein NJB14194_19160 [Mycobacterium montefiorense]GKU49352.1 hypothetical protein NJB14195_05990 [Mycobacterium montefiorense]
MDSGRFRELLGVPGPFASVYFEDSGDDDDPNARLELKWRVLRDELAQHGADASIIAAIEHAVLQLRLPIGRGGRAVIAAASGVLVNEYLLRPTARPVVRVSELPYIVPILEYGVTQSDYLLVVADPAGAFITSHFDATRLSETIEAELHTVADRIGELVHDTSWRSLFLVGDEGSRSSLAAALPDRIRERVTPLPIAVRRGGYDFEEIQRAIDSTLLMQRRSAMDTAAARFTEEVDRRSGLAVEGLGAVCSALSQGAVDTMIIGEIDDATVVSDEGLTAVAPSADMLGTQGAATAKTRRADEALPLLAISGGASVVRTDERIAPADGIGAVLNNAAAPNQAHR